MGYRTLRERHRSLLNGVIACHALTGNKVSRAQMAKAIRIKNTVHILKRNGRRNWKGELVRFMVAKMALQKDLI